MNTTLRTLKTYNKLPRAQHGLQTWLITPYILQHSQIPLSFNTYLYTFTFRVFMDSTHLTLCWYFCTLLFLFFLFSYDSDLSTRYCFPAHSCRAVSLESSSSLMSPHHDDFHTSFPKWHYRFFCDPWSCTWSCCLWRLRGVCVSPNVPVFSRQAVKRPRPWLNASSRTWNEYILHPRRRNWMACGSA